MSLLPRIQKLSISSLFESEKSPKKIIQTKKKFLNISLNKNILSRNMENSYEENKNNKNNLKTSLSHIKNCLSSTNRKKEVKMTSTNTQTQFEDFSKNINIFSEVSYTNLYKGRKYLPKYNRTILSNEFLKNHFFHHPSNCKNYYVNSNYLRFNNNHTKHIVSDDISLVGILQNQTNSNFNNKYNLKYWTNNKKKKEQIKQCFNLIKKGINLNDIDILLNGRKDISSYNIQTTPNALSEQKFYNLSNIKSIRERKGNSNLTVNTLEHIRPLTTINSNIYASKY